MMLCETKVSTPPSLGWVRHCGFAHHDFLPSFGLVGGMWIFWKELNCNPFNISSIVKSDRFWACNVMLMASSFCFTLVFIYAPPNYNLKYAFWEELIDFLKNISEPFVVMGDFNELSSDLDKKKKGGRVAFSFFCLTCMNHFFFY